MSACLTPTQLCGPYITSVSLMSFALVKYVVSGQRSRTLKLKSPCWQLRLDPPRVFLSHDWPQSISSHGDVPRLVREKRFLADEIAADTLGSPPLRDLLHLLQPAYWFAAHLHVRFAALVKHDGQKTLIRGQSIATVQQQNGSGPTSQNSNRLALGQRRAMAPSVPVVRNEDEIDVEIDDLDEVDRDLVATPPPSAVPVPTNVDEIKLDDVESEVEEAKHFGVNGHGSLVNPDEVKLDDLEDEVDGVSEPDAAATTAPPALPKLATTRFLALSKCLPGKDFLQVCAYVFHSSTLFLLKTI